MKMSIADIIKKSSAESIAQIIGAVVAMQTMGITDEEAIELEYPNLLKVLQSKIEVDYKQTNADRIRSMSDRELAEFLVTVETYGYHDQSVSGSLDMLEWLQEEVEE